jgi:pimeloyl-ACP methyl ester carboxylesterase
MVDGEAMIEGRRWRYSVSDNLDASTWALNVHGFMAGGGVYWRESARLAAKLGLRVINPNLPGFSGSDPLPWDDLRMSSFARGLAGLLDHLGASTALILGHSMGGAVAMQFAHDFPERTLGVVYRDGVATSSWK